MAISMPATVTGSSQTGLTSPTYTLTTDLALNSTSKQSAVTALGGTQTGVRTSSASDPFTITVSRPAQLKVLPAFNSSLGVLLRVPKNVYKVITRKGVIPAANQVSQVMPVRTEISVPAGADAYDAPNVRASLSLHFGFVNQLSASIGDTATSGLL